MIAFNRGLLSDDWTGRGRISDEALAARGCVTMMMYVNLASSLGRALAVADYFERQIPCSPMDHDLDATIHCLCGSPFDLEATPNLRRALRDGALEWAPAAPQRMLAPSRSR